MHNSKLVYSTDQGRIKEAPSSPAERSVSKDGIARIQRETKGRKGKGVSIITGLDLSEDKLKLLAKTLKKKCGCGGAVKAGTIELQTDAREKIKDVLAQQGIAAKLAGG